MTIFLLKAHLDTPLWKASIHMAHVHLMDVFFLLLAKVLKFKSSNSFSRRRFAWQDPAWFSLSINVFLYPSFPCLLKGKKLLKKIFPTVRWSTLIAESIYFHFFPMNYIVWWYNNIIKNYRVISSGLTCRLWFSIYRIYRRLSVGEAPISYPTQEEILIEI